MDIQDENFDDVETLNKLRLAAVEQALSTKQLADLDKAVSIIKAITDREKTAHENRDQPRLLRNEWYKTMATAIVPLLTLLTLLVTVWVQTSQWRLSRQANEDTAWRETTKNVLSNLTGSQPNALLALELLQPYLADARHGDEAFDLSLFVLTGVRDAVDEDLIDFFALPEAKITDHNLDHVLDKTRKMKTHFQLLGDEKDHSKRQKNSQMPSEGDNMQAKLRVIGNKVGAILRTRKMESPALNLTDTYFYNCNLQGANLRGAILTSAWFQGVDVSSAILANVQDPLSSVWWDTNWWEAQYIDGDLLKHLIEQYYPYSTENDLSGLPKQVRPPSEADYKQKVMTLCNAAGISCDKAKMKYGTPKLQNKAITELFGMIRSKI